VEISVTGHHVSLSENTRSQIQDDAAKLERFYSPLLECHITITEEGRDKKANVVVTCTRANANLRPQGRTLAPRSGWRTAKDATTT
jgi:ribosome-associated translation inhibitor RaiA